MADMFGAKGAIGGIFKGTQVALTLGKGSLGGGTGQKGALVQTITLSYTRNVTRVWELGSNDTYYIIGHTEGQAQMNRIVAKVENDILDELGDACKAKDYLLNMSSTADACEGGGAKINLTASGPMLTQRSFSADAGQFVLTSSAAIMFSGLEKK